MNHAHDTLTTDESFRFINTIERQSSFKFVQVGELEAKAPEYIIDQYLEKDTLCMIFGQSAAGKTFAVIDMLCCVATENDFHGLEINAQGPCIYICGEGKNGIARRFDAWFKIHGIDREKVPISISETSASFCDPEHTNQVVESIHDLAKQSDSPVLIVIDTLARNFSPGDENSTKDMGIFIQAMDKLRDLYNSTILIIHHTGHSEQSRGRGSSALKAALDAEYKISKNNSDVMKIEATKMKDAELPEPMTFKLKPIELDIVDNDGNPVTSAVLENFEGGYQSPISGKLGTNQIKALDVLKRLYEEKRKQFEDEGKDPNSAEVKVDEWKQECKEKGIDRKAFSSLKKSLSKRNEVIIEKEIVKLVS